MALTPDAFSGRVLKGPRCGVRLILESLDDHDRTVLSGALTDPLVQSATIGRVLRGEGHHIGDGTVSKHRRGECACGR